eukprot:gene1651-1803_t
MKVSEIVLLGLYDHEIPIANEELFLQALDSPLIKQFQEGHYINILDSFEKTVLCRDELITLCETTNENPYYAIHHRILDYLILSTKLEKDESNTTSATTSTSTSSVSSNVLENVFLLGLAYLQLYVQCNYTGPELINTLRNKIDLKTESAHSTVLMHLECDGYFPYKAVDVPHCLLIARCLLSFITNPHQGSWRENAYLDKDGILHPAMKSSEEIEKIDKVLTSLSQAQPPVLVTAPLTAFWWHARATVLQARALQCKAFETMPMLWKEVKSTFQITLEGICGLTRSSDLDKDDSYQFDTLLIKSKIEGDSMMHALQGMLWVEWGLARHFFSTQDKGKLAFQRAREAIQLELSVTAALGKRTKYQRDDIAQLYLYAKSHLIGHHEVSDETSPPPSSAVATIENNNQQQEDQPEATYEIGRRMVKEAEGGEEAAIREVLLDKVDTGAAENIILEGGPHFNPKEEIHKGGALHAIDQVVLLALCLDVSNSNPADGLTNEEMMPYIERVLDQAKNWMVHSTSLLERSWIEFERRKTMDRAMLQIQALIDQHSTKLTVMQSTYQSIEESASVNQRIQYIYGLIYPSQFELKRDLAQKYLSYQVFMSALSYFKELEMWDEVVSCYQLLQKPHRAEMVVREQLRISQSPYMLTALADLTGQEELYEQAWNLSQHRYARAKRTLAKLHYDRGDYASSIDHLNQALQVQPMVATAWYLLGVACMRIERWEEGVQAFLRCVQQDEEIGEAWANIGAIHMRTQDWAKAYHALTEAYKQKREDWKVLENLMLVTLNLQRWKESIRVMTSLLDLRHKSVRPVHIPQLRYLMKVIVAETVGLKQDTANDSSLVEVKSEAEDKVTELPELAVHLQTLFLKITSSVKSDAEVWDVVSEFYDHYGYYAAALDARLKQFRALIAEPQWEKKEDSVKRVALCADQVLLAVNYKEATKTDFYSIRMLLQSMVRKVESAVNQQLVVSAIVDQLSGLKEKVTHIEELIKARGV